MNDRAARDIARLIERSGCSIRFVNLALPVADAFWPEPDGFKLLLPQLPNLETLTVREVMCKPKEGLGHWRKKETLPVTVWTISLYSQCSLKRTKTFPRTFPV